MKFYFLECQQAQHTTVWLYTGEILTVNCLLQSPSEDQKALVDQACQQLTADNTELASAFIQKTAVEKAVSEMDKRMTNVSNDYMRNCYNKAKSTKVQSTLQNIFCTCKR